ncbi:MAG: histidinol-phosphate transaminase [Moraxella sp.]|nr:histidinol-phosphate transaminase [Moraxella sp.]
MNDTQLLNPDILALTPYVAGEQPKIANLVKLNTNENPYPPSPKVLEAIKHDLGDTGDGLRRYPDPDATLLKQVIAKQQGVDSTQVFVGNGSDEVLAHIFKAFFNKQKPVLTPDISYSFYPVYAGLFGLTLKMLPLDDEFAMNVAAYCCGEDSSGIIFANPNAPTGRAIGLEEVRKIVSSNPACVVVVDEAYVDFGAQSAVALVSEFANLVVCQTTSKSRALAGMRVGFAIAQAHLIAALETVKNSFNSYPLDRLAQVAAIASFEDEAYFEKMRQKVIKSREALRDELVRLGFEVAPSLANFVFARHATKQASDIAQALREKGVIVRYFNQPKINNHLRISVGNDAENAALIKALEGIVL